MSHDGENIMVILSSPSGVGKTTLTKKIQQKYQSFKISVSHTTRLPRSNEIDGIDYHFVSHKKFEELIKSVQDRSLADQQTFLNQTIEDWIGDEGMNDDISLIAFRI